MINGKSSIKLLNKFYFPFLLLNFYLNSSTCLQISQINGTSWKMSMFQLFLLFSHLPMMERLSQTLMSNVWKCSSKMCNSNCSNHFGCQQREIDCKLNLLF